MASGIQVGHQWGYGPTVTTLGAGNPGYVCFRDGWPAGSCSSLQLPESLPAVGAAPWEPTQEHTKHQCRLSVSLLSCLHT